MLVCVRISEKCWPFQSWLLCKALYSNDQNIGLYMCASLYCLTADCCIQSRLQAYSVTEKRHHVCSVLKVEWKCLPLESFETYPLCKLSMYWNVLTQKAPTAECGFTVCCCVFLFHFIWHSCTIFFTARKITIKRELTDIKTTERETASFEVELSHPNVPGTWTRNGIQLKPTHHFRMTAKGQVHSLTVSNLSVEDTGTFTFCVENLKTSARLVVKGESFLKRES